MQRNDYDETTSNVDLEQDHPLDILDFHKQTGEVFSREYIQAIVELTEASGTGYQTNKIFEMLKGSKRSSDQQHSQNQI